MVVDTVTITVDVRERRSGVPRLLAELGLVVELVTLAVGDYAIRSRVIERKTVSDLGHSLADHRLWSQVAALRRDPHSGSPSSPARSIADSHDARTQRLAAERSSSPPKAFSRASRHRNRSGQGADRRVRIHRSRRVSLACGSRDRPRNRPGTSPSRSQSPSTPAFSSQIRSPSPARR